MAKRVKKIQDIDVSKIFQTLKENDVKIVDLKFTDIIGQWQHFSISIKEFSSNIFKNGVGFDGSSIRGFRRIHESDMLLIPDASTAFIDPFSKVPTISLICDIVDPITHQPYIRDPRRIAKKAENYLRNTGIADSALFGPEPEFFILDSIRFDQNSNFGYYYLDSNEGIWNSGSEQIPNLGHRPRYKEGYFPVAPIDTLQDIRTEMTLILESLGIEVEVHHHEVATAGQTEIDMKRDLLIKMADKYQIFRYVTKNVAKKYSKSVTFMPKPIYGDNGSGMHVHQSLWKGKKPLFAGTEYAGLSKIALYYIGGLLKHAPALCAFTNPTTNSYRRLVPGFEAPVNLAYSQRNRSASIRIPMYSQNPESKRIEFRCPDPACNPYIGFAAMLMAGIDGIINKINPGDPLDKDIYEMEPEELADVPSTPATLEAALEELDRDNEFLLRGDVFPEDFIRNWIEYKFSRETKQMQLRPHPYEFMLYYDV